MQTIRVVRTLRTKANRQCRLHYPDACHRKRQNGIRQRIRHLHFKHPTTSVDSTDSQNTTKSSSIACSPSTYTLVTTSCRRANPQKRETQPSRYVFHIATIRTAARRRPTITPTKSNQIGAMTLRTRQNVHQNATPTTTITRHVIQCAL